MTSRTFSLAAWTLAQAYSPLVATSSLSIASARWISSYLVTTISTSTSTSTITSTSLPYLAMAFLYSVLSSLSALALLFRVSYALLYSTWAGLDKRSSISKLASPHLGGEVVVEALLDQRGLLEELVEPVRGLDLEHLLGLVLLQDHHRRVHLDLELVQDPLALLLRLPRLPDHVPQVLVLEQVGRGARLVDGALEGDGGAVELGLVGVLPGVPEGDLHHGPARALPDELGDLRVALGAACLAEQAEGDALQHRGLARPVGAGDEVDPGVGRPVELAVAHEVLEVHPLDHAHVALELAGAGPPLPRAVRGVVAAPLLLLAALLLPPGSLQVRGHGRPHHPAHRAQSVTVISCSTIPTAGVGSIHTKARAVAGWGGRQRRGEERAGRGEYSAVPTTSAPNGTF